jgi:hypothetical protein
LVEINQPTQQIIEQWKSKIRDSLDTIKSCSDANVLPDILYDHMVCFYKAEKEVPKIWKIMPDYYHVLLGENKLLGYESDTTKLLLLHTALIIRLMDALKDDHMFGDSEVFEHIAMNISCCNHSWSGDGTLEMIYAPEETLVRIANCTTKTNVLRNVGIALFDIHSFDHALDCLLRVFHACKTHSPEEICALSKIYLEKGDKEKANFYISKIKRSWPVEYANFIAKYIISHNPAESQSETQLVDKALLRQLVNRPNLDDAGLGKIIRTLYS